MAWEEESIDGGADFEEVGGKKNIVKMILLVVVGLAVLGGIGYAVYFFFMQEDPAPEEGEGGEAEVAEVVDEPEPETGFKVDLEKFTLNLADKGEPRYLVARIALEVSTEELQLAMTDENDPKLYLLKSRDQILQILRSKTSEEINDPSALRELGKEIEFKLNRVLKEGKVLNVYFGEFVMQ